MGEELKVASPGWIAAAADTLGLDSTLALVQGYPYSGFGVVREGVVGLPKPGLSWDPELSWDLRLFSAKGEWHAWKIGTVWHERRFPNEVQSGLGSFFRDYILWGETPEPMGDWTRFIETRGAEIWVPGRFTKALKLKIRLIVDHDKESQLAGIVDAVICGIEER